MMGAVIRTMTLRIHTRYSNLNGGEVNCRNCPTKLSPGKEYVARPVRGGRGKSKSVPYCVSCAKVLNII